MITNMLCFLSKNSIPFSFPDPIVYNQTKNKIIHGIAKIQNKKN